MPNYIRPKWTGARVFFTVCLAARSTDLLVREVDALRRAVAKTKSETPFGIDAWVVLPDHLHCIWQLPKGDCDFSSRWRLIKGRFAHEVEAGHRSASKYAKAEKGIWQRRFWDHHLRDEADYLTHLRYCWWNPVKHGLVDRPVDWEFSSIHREIRS
jgi:putative transposase